METTILNNTVTINNTQYKIFNRAKLYGNLFEKTDEILNDFIKNKANLGITRKLDGDDESDMWVIRNSIMRAFHRMAIKQGWSIKEVEEVLNYASDVSSSEAQLTGEYNNDLYLSYLFLYFEEN